MKKNVLGIISKTKPTRSGTYYSEAFSFYDEVIYIDPMKVSYIFEKGQVPLIELEGRKLNDLSMVYLFSHKTGTRRHVILLVRALMLCGCPISDNFERYLRDDIGKGYETLKKVGTEGDIPSYIFCSYSIAKSFFEKCDKEVFPVISKPIFGNTGKGIKKLENRKEVLSYLKRYFARSKNFLTFEAYINFEKEWRVYVVDGQVVCSYERVRYQGKVASNLHQGGVARQTSPEFVETLNRFVLDNLVDAYKQGIYGVDVGMSDHGDLYIIETNRCPGWRGVEMTSDINFPYEVNRILFQRARKYG